MMSNAEDSSKISPAALMFTGKVSSIFDELLSGYKMKSRQFETTSGRC